MLNHFATGAAGDRSTAGPQMSFDTWSGLSCHRMIWQVTREVVEPEEPEEPGTPVVPAETQDSSSDSSDLCTSARQSAKRPSWSCTKRTRGVPPLVSVAILMVQTFWETLTLWMFPFTVWSHKSAVAAKADAGGCLCRWRHVNFNCDPFLSLIRNDSKNFSEATFLKIIKHQSILKHHQSINQSIDRSIDRSINQSINQSSVSASCPNQRPSWTQKPWNGGACSRSARPPRGSWPPRCGRWRPRPA